MGYCISVNVRSVSLRDKMLQFLKENWRQWPELNGGSKDDPAYSCPPETGETLCYNSKRKCNIGIEYHVIDGAERDYIYQFCRWLAITIGKKKKFKGVEDSVSYIVYDGFECWPVMITGKNKPCKDSEWNWAFYDEYGTKKPDEFDVVIYKLYGQDMLKELEKIRNEIIRLDKLWEEFCKEKDNARNSNI